MNIFNFRLNGSDAEYYKALTKCKKKDWIKENTGVIDDELIDEFLKLPINESVDCGCGKHKTVENGQNISERVSSEVTKGKKLNSTPRVSLRGTNKRRGNA